MSQKYDHIITTLFNSSVNKLQRSNKKPPNPEILRLYREVMKFCAQFDWKNQNGEIWRDVLRKSARKEFEESKEETDPVILYRMLVTTRDAMTQTKEMLIRQYAVLHGLEGESGAQDGRNLTLEKNKKAAMNSHRASFDIDGSFHQHLYGSFKD